MLLLGVILFPLVLGADPVRIINGYNVHIDGGTLKNVEAAEHPSPSLSLSNLNIQKIDKDAFTNLGSLEFIDLSNNELTNVDLTLTGLNNLKQLNLSSNRLENIAQGSLNGIKNSTDVFLKDNPLQTISTGAFEQQQQQTDTPARPTHHHGRPSLLPKKSDVDLRTMLGENPRAKLCLEGTKVKSLEPLAKDENLANGNCREVLISNIGHTANLQGQQISEFERGWYQLQAFPITKIDLDNNSIARIDEKLLNDLPTGVLMVSLKNNKLARLEKGVINNVHLDSLDLSNNEISQIEKDALKNTNLTKSLSLNGNQLSSTCFIKSLPNNLTELNLQDNRINEISGGSFLKLQKLRTLTLDGNAINVLPSQVFKGLSSLKFLSVTNNGLSNIAAGAFEDVVFLRMLDVTNNSLTTIDPNLFTHFEVLLRLKLSGNKLSQDTKVTMAALHYTVHSLEMDRNGIERLTSQSFVDVPILDLSLNGNKIKKIERDSFSLPYLRLLSLNDNELRDLDGESFKGLGSVATLRLAGNGITHIQKGAFEHLSSVYELDLSNNPITKLENGALYGLQKKENRLVRVRDTPLELIRGGVFDNL